MEKDDKKIEKFDDNTETEEEVMEEIDEAQNKSTVPIEAIEEETIEEELKTEKKSNKILLIICGVLLIIIALLIYFILLKDKNNNSEPTPDKPISNNVIRPSNNIEYITLNQNYFGFNCNTDDKDVKLDSLSKGTTIKCKFEFDLGYNVSELYFDIDNSSNVKYKKETNDSKYTIINDNNKVYKLSTDTPEKKLEGNIIFYYEVINENDKTGYIEINNVVFKDDKDNYYKVLNKISSFPPEKTNKIYIYEYKDFEDEKYYSAYKSKKDKEDVYDTFVCKNEDCDVITQAYTNFLIKDDNLVVYDMTNKAKYTVDYFDIKNYEKYNYEITSNKNHEPYGVLFYGEYVDNIDCKTYNDFCIDKALSGNEVSYYSFKENNFTISLDYGFIGSSIYSNDQDTGLLLMKNNKYGYYNYEKDTLVIEMSSKYTNIDYDSGIDAILLEYKDSNGEYYYTFTSTSGNTFTLPKKDEISKLEGTNISYVTYRNRNNKVLYYLFNSKNEQINIKYVIEKDIISTNKKLIIKKDDLYNVYDKDGNKLYVTEFEDKDILAVTKNYLVVNDSGSIELYDLKNHSIVGITTTGENTKFVKADETDNTINVYIIEPTETEGTNGNKYIINAKTKSWTKEEIKIDN